MSKFDIQGNPRDKYVLNFKKSSFHSVNKSIWSNDKELLKKMARLLMENYQTVYIDESDSDILWLHGAIHQSKLDKDRMRSEHFEIFRNSKNERLA